MDQEVELPLVEWVAGFVSQLTERQIVMLLQPIVTSGHLLYTHSKKTMAEIMLRFMIKY